MNEYLYILGALGWLCLSIRELSTYTYRWIHGTKSVPWLLLFFYLPVLAFAIHRTVN